MCKRDEDIDLWSGNIQIQSWKFKPLESGKDSVDINWIRRLDSNEQDGVRYKRYQQRKNRPHGLMSLSEHVEKYFSKISNKINEYKLSSSICLVLFCKLNWDGIIYDVRWCVQFPCSQYEKPIKYLSCFVGSFSMEAHLTDIVLRASILFLIPCTKRAYLPLKMCHCVLLSWLMFWSWLLLTSYKEVSNISLIIRN